MNRALLATCRPTQYLASDIQFLIRAEEREPEILPSTEAETYVPFFLCINGSKHIVLL